MNLDCTRATDLVPSYLDGELSDEQAGPLRAHLMDCRDCRETAKEGRNLARWFEAAREAARENGSRVPAGFAARVARRAFAGDPGLLVPSPPDTGQVRAGGNQASGSLLPFVLRLTAVAAGLLFLLSIAIQQMSRPGSHELEALPSLPIDEPYDGPHDGPYDGSGGDTASPAGAGEEEEGPDEGEPDVEDEGR